MAENFEQTVGPDWEDAAYWARVARESGATSPDAISARLQAVDQKGLPHIALAGAYQFRPQEATGELDEVGQVRPVSQQQEIARDPAKIGQIIGAMTTFQAPHTQPDIRG